MLWYRPRICRINLVKHTQKMRLNRPRMAYAKSLTHGSLEGSTTVIQQTSDRNNPMEETLVICGR